MLELMRLKHFQNITLNIKHWAVYGMFEYKKIDSRTNLTYKFSGVLAMGDCAQQLGKDLQSLKDRRSPCVLFDLSALKSLDSSGVGILLIYRKILKNMEGTMCISLARDSQAHKAIVSSALDQIFDVFFDHSEAIEFLKSRNVDLNQIQNHILKQLREEQPFDQNMLISAIKSNFLEYRQALNMLEQVIDRIHHHTENEAENEFEAAMQKNRLMSMLYKIESEYLHELLTDRPGYAIMLGHDDSACNVRLLEMALHFHGFSIVNCGGAPFDKTVQLESLTDKIHPECAGICSRNPSRNIRQVVTATKIIQTKKIPIVFLYMPPSEDEFKEEKALENVAILPSILELIDYLTKQIPALRKNAVTEA